MCIRDSVLVELSPSKVCLRLGNDVASVVDLTISTGHLLNVCSLAEVTGRIRTDNELCIVGIHVGQVGKLLICPYRVNGCGQLLLVAGECTGERECGITVSGKEHLVRSVRVSLL